MACCARRRVQRRALGSGLFLSAAVFSVAADSRAADSRAAELNTAEGKAAVEVEVVACSDALEKGRLRDAIRVELRNLDPELVSYIEASHPRVVIACHEPTPDTIDLSVTTDHGEALHETLDASEAGTARFIAIAIAESLAAQASLPEPEEPKPPPTKPSAPPVEKPPAAPPAPAVDPYPVWWWRAAAGGRLFGDPGLPSFDGRLGVERVSSERWSLALDLSGTRGSALVGSGELSATTFSVGLALHRRIESRRLLAQCGLGVRAGVFRWHGSPSDLSSVQGLTGYAPWAGPFADLSLGLLLTPRFRVEVAAEGGFTPTQVKATENSNIIGEMGPLWLSLELGVAGRL